MALRLTLINCSLTHLLRRHSSLSSAAATPALLRYFRAGRHGDDFPSSSNITNGIDRAARGRKGGSLGYGYRGEESRKGLGSRGVVAAEAGVVEWDYLKYIIHDANANSYSDPKRKGDHVNAVTS